MNGKPIAVIRPEEVAGAFVEGEHLMVNLRAGGLMKVYFPTHLHAFNALELLTQIMVQEDRSNETDHKNQQTVLWSELKRIGGGLLGEVSGVPGFFRIAFNGPPSKGDIPHLEWEGSYEEMLEVLKKVRDGEGNPGLDRAVQEYEDEQQA
jgi:hypothetical protein